MKYSFRTGTKHTERINYVLSVGLATVTIAFICIICNSFLNIKPFLPPNGKIIKYESFDMNKKQPLILREPPKGDPNASSNEETKKTPKNNTKTVSKKRDKLDPTKIEKDAKDAEKIKATQDSLNKVKADSISNARTQDSLKTLAENAKNKLGLENGNINSKNIDTTHHPVIGGPTEFGLWLAQELSSKYTPELKAYGRDVTITVVFNIKYDSTITDIKLIQKTYKGQMDDVILETIKNCKIKFKPAINPETKLPIKSQICMSRIILPPIIRPINKNQFK